MKLSEFDNPNVETFRRQCIRELMQSAKWICTVAHSALKEKVLRFDPTGSITEPENFTKDSNIDGLIYVNIVDEPKGILEKETEHLQKIMQRCPFSFGILNIGVYNIPNVEHFA